MNPNRTRRKTICAGLMPSPQAATIAADLERAQGGITLVNAYQISHGPLKGLGAVLVLNDQWKWRTFLYNTPAPVYNNPPPTYRTSVPLPDRVDR